MGEVNKKNIINNMSIEEFIDKVRTEIMDYVTLTIGIIRSLCIGLLVFILLLRRGFFTYVRRKKEGCKSKSGAVSLIISLIVLMALLLVVGVVFLIFPNF